MSRSELAWRSLHDLGLASWFGGSVFGTVALPHPEAAATEIDARSTVQSAERAVESSTWQRWSPVVTASMATHLVGGAGLLLWNRGRHRHQKGVAATSAVKAGLTVTAVALTIGAAAEGYRSEERRRRIEESADKSLLRDQERADRLMRVVGALIPATTGALVVLGALEGEQQRPREMVRGVIDNALDAFQDAAARVPTAALDALPSR
jgi:hypothetical protein